MPVPLDQFVKQLEDSGILDGDTLREFVPPVACPKDAEELADQLVHNKKLTRFQAETAYQGKATSLVLGNCVLLEKIGEGGMGQVFKAHHRRLDRLVAVKLLPPARTADESAISRFEREVRAAARLRHPNIVATDDADCACGVHFLVMEYVEGSNLSVLVRQQGPLPVPKAVNYVLQVARGLEFAHEQGVIHRDIKPSNLLLDKSGTIKILDMGLARLDACDPSQDQLTGTGQVMGTVDYMSPEQAHDTRRADARADVYSLGITLWYLLTGRVVYSGESAISKQLAHREQPIPSLCQACPTASPGLEAVFRRMVAKLPESRYQSMTDLISDLQFCQAEISAGRRGDFTIDSSLSVDSSNAAVGATKTFPAAGVSKSTQVPRSTLEGNATSASQPRGASSRVISAPSIVMAIGILIALLTLGWWTVNAGRWSDEGATASRELAPREEQPGVIENSIQMRLIQIPSGMFWMGEQSGAPDVMPEESPRHKVHITRGFYLGESEVTQLQYEKVMGHNPSHHALTGEGREMIASIDTSRFPVENVSWDDAVRFCRELSSHPEERAAGRSYRLPTEAEWEYACRAGATTRFTFGDALSRSQAAFSEPGATIGVETSSHPVPVGSFPPNPSGFHDMHGNVWEWCGDWFGPYGATDQQDPQGPSSGIERVIRGGGWAFEAKDCRSASRSHRSPDAVGRHYGFRVVCELEEK